MMSLKGPRDYLACLRQLFRPRWPQHPIQHQVNTLQEYDEEAEWRQIRKRYDVAFDEFKDRMNAIHKTQQHDADAVHRHTRRRYSDEFKRFARRLGSIHKRKGRRRE